MNMPLAVTLLVAILLTPTCSLAQGFGAALGGWSTTGARPEDDPAKGLRLSGYFDRAWQQHARLRFEGAFTQAGFTRDFPARLNRHVSENSIELAVHAMSRPLGTMKLRAFAGPVISVGIGCGTDGENDSNGRVGCDESGIGNDGNTRVGGALGFHGELGAAGRLTFDLRAQANTIAAARGRGAAVSLSLGFRTPR
ncbi:MAG: hypothetical protein ACYC7F_10330 [Gemmatimonadaceae bacterium]